MSECISDKELDRIANGNAASKREHIKNHGANAKTAEALAILGAGKPHSELGFKGRKAHDTEAYEDHN